MLVSMTGYGKAEDSYQSKKIIAEIRSLNSKQLDLNVRLPSIFREKEMDIRASVAQRLGRGKVDLTIYIEEAKSTSAASINAEIFSVYYKQLTQVARDNGIDLTGEPVTQIILHLPDVLTTSKNEPDETANATLMLVVDAAINNLIDFRNIEGAVLQEDLLLRVRLISNLLKQVETFEDKRIDTLRQRLMNSIVELSADATIDKDRFEQEIIYYLEKLDITEEKVRLSNHCNYFVETVNQTEAVGRKLGFIAQEMGREINTLGSKANDADIQKLVVMMKDELEKIKEQLLNIL